MARKSERMLQRLLEDAGITDWRIEPAKNHQRILVAGRQVAVAPYTGLRTRGRHFQNLCATLKRAAARQSS